MAFPVHRRIKTELFVDDREPFLKEDQNLCLLSGWIHLLLLVNFYSLERNVEMKSSKAYHVNWQFKWLSM